MWNHFLHGEREWPSLWTVSLPGITSVFRGKFNTVSEDDFKKNIRPVARIRRSWKPFCKDELSRCNQLHLTTSRFTTMESLIQSSLWWLTLNNNEVLQSKWLLDWSVQRQREYGERKLTSTETYSMTSNIYIIHIFFPGGHHGTLIM